MPIPNCKLPDPASLYKELAHDEIAIDIREACNYLTGGDAKSCINHLNRAAIKNVDSPWGWIVAATAHCQLGNYKMAIDVSNKGLRYSGDNSHLFDCLGVAHAGLGDLATAQHHFQKAFRSNPHNGNSIVNLTNTHLAQQAINAAFEVTERGLQKNPDHPEIRHLYIQLHPAWASSLESERIRIRPRTALDDPFIIACYANQHFMNNYNRYLADTFKPSKSSTNPELKSRLNVYKNKCVQWIIEKVNHTAPSTCQTTPIGLASLAAIEISHRRAEILLGFPDTQFNGSGIPLAAMLMIMDFAFNTIGFNKLTSIVYATNERAQKSTLALGFKQEGFFRKHLYDHKLNIWVDTYQNGILAEEFNSNIQLVKLSTRMLNKHSSRTQSSSLFNKLDSMKFLTNHM